MKIMGLDEREYTWKPTGRYGKRNPKASQPHISARTLLNSLFPAYTILEEVHLPGAGYNLYIDFYIPQLSMGLEVQGRQHYEFTQHFHKDQAGFERSIHRDSTKAEWCELNQITYIVLPHWEDLDEWKSRIIGS